MKNRVDIMLNDNCNISCIFCYHMGFSEENHNFSRERIYEVLEYGNNNGITELYISGGEPTISENLFYTLETAKSFGYTSIKIMTNGLKFNNIDFCKKLSTLGVTNLAISMHGHDEFIYELHAGKKGIYNLFIKGLYNSRKFFDVEVNVVITKYNLSYLDKQGKLLKSIGINKIHLQHIVPNHLTLRKLLPSKEDVELYINNFIENYKNKLNITLEFFPYCLINEKKYLGNFSYENDFITNTPEMFDDWSNGIKTNKLQKEECLNCNFKLNCKGFWY